MGRSRASDATLDLPRMSARDPTGELPVVELDPEDFADLEARARDSVAPFRPQAVPDAQAPDAWVAELFPEVAAPAAEQPPQSVAAVPAPETPGAPAALGPDTGGMDDLLLDLGANEDPDPPLSDIEVAAEPAAAAVTAPLAPLPEPEPEPEPEPQVEPAPPILAQLTRAPEAPAEPVVDWPAPEASQVFAVRLLSGPERFPGRAVRQALAAEGFVLGKFAIFHKPGPDGRALLSIASLNKPGTFEAHSIDMQRFGGLNLFAVLPGPLPGPATVDELLASAQILAQRLRGTLWDDQGEPLTPSRTAVMRNLAAAAPT